MGGPWRAMFLGGFLLVRGTQQVERLRSLKMEALLACLAAAPGRQFSRDELIARFWPDNLLEVGQNNLRVALSRLRSALGAGILETTRFHVRLVEGAVQTDVADFEDAVRRGDTLGALELYRGPYLPGVYDDETVTERERLEGLAARMREHAARFESSLTPPSLPAFLTRFLAREQECAELSALIRERRLTTVLGPGGIGKTRLAIEAARSLADELSLVAFVPLEECFEPALLPERIGATLGQAASATPLKALAMLLHGQPTLLVLDNLEQLVEVGVGEVVERLLGALPTLRILATSRRLLGVPGEQAFPLAPLDSEQSQRLFIEYARRARPGFAPEKSPALGDLCTRLDGLPLALELAASRLRSQSVAEILEQLMQGERPLRQPGNKQTRHASLERTIAWSWCLLPAHQQDFGAQLSVFRGGWSEEDAAAVTDYTDAHEHLAALTDASLVVAEETLQGRTRFRFLETIRAFAARQLTDGRLQETRARHRRRFLDSTGAADVENLLAALTSALEDRDAEAAYGLLVGYGLTLRGHIGAESVRPLCDAVLALPAPTPRLRIRALGFASILLGDRGELGRGDALLAEALALAGDDPGLRALALSLHGQLALGRYDPPDESIAMLEESLVLAESVADHGLCGQILRLLGVQLTTARRFDEALDALGRAEALFAAQSNERERRYTWQNRATALHARGQFEEALALHQSCLKHAREANDRGHEGFVLNNLSATLDSLGRHAEALARKQDALRLFQRLGNLRGMALVFWNAVETLNALGQKEKATALLRFAEAFWVEHVGPLTDDDIAVRDSHLGEASIEATPALLTLDEARKLLLSL